MKKVILFIVEGKSEEAAYGPILENWFERNSDYRVLFTSEKSDYLTGDAKDPANIPNKLYELIEKTLKREHLAWTDLAMIVQITDTDGCFIPDDNVVEQDSSGKIVYQAKRIITPDKIGIELRNFQKSTNLRRLIDREELFGVAYRIYYSSCNLDHVLHNVRNMAGKSKVQKAMSFARQYWRRPENFVEFLNSQAVRAPGDFDESWAFIQEDLNSLKRWTNFGRLFDPESVVQEVAPEAADRKAEAMPQDVRPVAFVFDLDDTLYRQADVFKRAYFEVFGDRYPHLPVEELYRASRIHSDELFELTESGEISHPVQQRYRIQMAFADYGIVLSDHEATTFQKAYFAQQKQITMNRQIEKILARLMRNPNVEIALLTNGPSGHQRMKMNAVGTQRFFPKDRVMISGEVGCIKPEREIFDKCIETFGFDPERTYMIGDSYENDIYGAKNAGWHTVWLKRSRGETTECRAADYIVRDERALSDTLDEILEKTFA